MRRRFFVFSPDNLLLRWFENEKEYRAGHSKGELEVMSMRPAVEGSLIMEIRGAHGRSLLVRADIADVHLLRVIKDQLPPEDPFALNMQGLSEKSAPGAMMPPGGRDTGEPEPSCGAAAGSEASRCTAPWSARTPSRHSSAEHRRSSAVDSPGVPAPVYPSRQRHRWPPDGPSGAMGQGDGRDHGPAAANTGTEPDLAKFA